jgi:SGNH domain (fused to AT3 domains)
MGDAVVDYIAAHKIKDVFLACLWEGYAGKYDRERFTGAFIETVRALNDAGSKVWVVLQLPSHDAPVAKRIVRSILLERIAARGSALSMSTFAERKSCLKSNGCLRDSTSDFLILRRCFMTR